MSLTIRWSAAALLLVLGLGCTTDGAAPAETPTFVSTAPATPLASPTIAPSPTPEAIRRDIRATRLLIPSLTIDTEVQTSRTIPYTYTPPPGCPARPQDTETLVVPAQGVSTPADNLEGLENVAWIFGHSRWLGAPGIFLSLQEMRLGDELFIDGVDRTSGEQLSNQRFVVEGIYLTDVDSGETLLNAESPGDIPKEPIVVLQTSVREDGAGKQWILSEEGVLANATNLVEGDLNDPCKYLLLFVIAQAS